MDMDGADGKPSAARIAGTAVIVYLTTLTL
jgi:hypothetical protein